MTYEEARAEHTAALRAWLSSRGEDEPAAHERLREARAVVNAKYAELMGWRLSLRTRRRMTGG